MRSCKFKIYNILFTFNFMLLVKYLLLCIIININNNNNYNDNNNNNNKSVLQAPTRCDDGCQSFESLGHMIQKCPRTDGPRHVRHDDVMRRLEHVVKEKGYTTKIEPRIPTEQGLKIPDLCAWKSDTHIPSMV